MRHTLMLITSLLLVPLAALHADDTLWSHLQSTKDLGELRGMMAE